LDRFMPYANFPLPRRQGGLFVQPSMLADFHQCNQA
jgi:hypothetical protein